MEQDVTLRVDWPDFDWLEYQGIDGVGLTSRIGATGGIVRLIPARTTLTIGHARTTAVVGYELTVGSKLESQLVGVSLARARKIAEAIVRARYPQHFRGRPGDPVAGQGAAATSPGTRVSGFVRRAPDSRG